MTVDPTSNNRTVQSRRHVREFRPQDQAVVRDLIQSGLRSRWGADFDESANPDTDDLWTNYVEPGGEIVVCEVDGMIAAVGILTIEPSPAYTSTVTTDAELPRLRRISVSDDHRRQGLGRLIVDELVRKAAGRGATNVLVSTDTPWTDAVALYRSCGFKPIHQDDEEIHLLLAIESS